MLSSLPVTTTGFGFPNGSVLERSDRRFALDFLIGWGRPRVGATGAGRNDQTLLSSARSLEPNSVLPCHQEGIVARVSPCIPLNVGGVRVVHIRPPLRPSGTVRQHAAENQLDLSEGQFEFSPALAFEVVSERIVFPHLATMPEARAEARVSSVVPMRFLAQQRPPLAIRSLSVLIALGRR